MLFVVLTRCSGADSGLHLKRCRCSKSDRLRAAVAVCSGCAGCQPLSAGANSTRSFDPSSLLSTNRSWRLERSQAFYCHIDLLHTNTIRSGTTYRVWSNIYHIDYIKNHSIQSLTTWVQYVLILKFLGFLN